MYAPGVYAQAKSRRSANEANDHFLPSGIRIPMHCVKPPAWQTVSIFAPECRFRAAGIVLICTAFLLTASCVPRSSDHPSAPPRDITKITKKKQPSISVEALERRIHERVNEERKKHGLSSLTWNDALNRIARQHSMDMARRGYFLARSQSRLSWCDSP